MSKRLIRIFAPSIPRALTRLLRQKIHVVLYSGHTIFGHLDSFSGGKLTIGDLRSHNHEINLEDIEEIILDRHSENPVNMTS